MKTYTNLYSNEKMYILSEKELKQREERAIKKRKQYNKRLFKRVVAWLFLWAFKISVVVVLTLVVMLYFWCQIPPM